MDERLPIIAHALLKPAVLDLLLECVDRLIERVFRFLFVEVKIEIQQHANRMIRILLILIIDMTPRRRFQDIQGCGFFRSRELVVGLRDFQGLLDALDSFACPRSCSRRLHLSSTDREKQTEEKGWHHRGEARPEAEPAVNGLRQLKLVD